MSRVSAVLRYTTVPTLPSGDGLSEADLPQHSSIKLDFGDETTGEDLITNLDTLIARRLPGRVRDTPSELLYYPAGSFMTSQQQSQQGGGGQGQQQQQQPAPIAIPIGATLLQVPAIAARYEAELSAAVTGAPTTKEQPIVFLVRRHRQTNTHAIANNNTASLLNGNANADPFAALLNQNGQMGSLGNGNGNNAADPAAQAERLVAEAMATLRADATAATIARIEGGGGDISGLNGADGSSSPTTATTASNRMAQRTQWFERLKSYPNAAHLADTLEDEEEALQAYLRLVERRNAELKARRGAQADRIRQLTETMEQQGRVIRDCAPDVEQRDGLNRDVDRLRMEIEVQDRRKDQLLSQLEMMRRAEEEGEGEQEGESADAHNKKDGARDNSPVPRGAGPLLTQLQHKYAAEKQQQQQKSSAAAAAVNGTGAGAFAADGSFSPQQQISADAVHQDALEKIQMRMGFGVVGTSSDNHAGQQNRGGGEAEDLEFGVDDAAYTNHHHTQQHQHAVGSRPPTMNNRTAGGMGNGGSASFGGQMRNSRRNSNAAGPIPTASFADWDDTAAAGSVSPQANPYQQHEQHNNNGTFSPDVVAAGGAMAALHERYSMSPRGGADALHYQQQQQQQQYGGVLPAASYNPNAVWGGNNGHHRHNSGAAYHPSANGHHTQHAAAALEAAFEEVTAVDDESWLSPELAQQVAAVLEKKGTVSASGGPAAQYAGLRTQQYAEQSQPPPQPPLEQQQQQQQQQQLPLPRYLQSSVADRFTRMSPDRSVYGGNTTSNHAGPTAAFQSSSSAAAINATHHQRPATFASDLGGYLNRLTAGGPPPPAPPPNSSLAALMASHDQQNYSTTYHHHNQQQHGNPLVPPPATPAGGSGPFSSRLPPPSVVPSSYNSSANAVMQQLGGGGGGLVNTPLPLPPPPQSQPSQHQFPSHQQYGMSDRGQALMATLESRRAMAINQPFYPNPAANSAYVQSFDYLHSGGRIGAPPQAPTSHQMGYTVPLPPPPPAVGGPSGWR